MFLIGCKLRFTFLCTMALYGVCSESSRINVNKLAIDDKVCHINLFGKRKECHFHLLSKINYFTLLKKRRGFYFFFENSTFLRHAIPSDDLVLIFMSEESTIIMFTTYTYIYNYFNQREGTIKQYTHNSRM